MDGRSRAGRPVRLLQQSGEYLGAERAQPEPGLEQIWGSWWSLSFPLVLGWLQLFCQSSFAPSKQQAHCPAECTQPGQMKGSISL